MTDIKKLRDKTARRNVGADAPGGGYTRHVIFCTGSDCGGGEGKDSLKHLRKRLKALGADRQVFCTPTDCLGICRGGPLAVVYPEGTWYHSLTPDACDRVVDEHLIGGKSVEELVITENPLVGG